MPDYLTKVRITDPDAVDRVLVNLKNTKRGNIVKSWRLGNYMSTGIVDLRDGKHFLSIDPYIDPLPVWFKVYNMGARKLLAKCVLSELQKDPGSKQFKDIGILKPNRWLYVPATVILEYRVERFRLGRLDIMKVKGIKTDHLRGLNLAKIINVEDLAKASLSKLTGIFEGGAEAMHERAKALNGAVISASTFGSLANRRVTAVAKWSTDRIAKTGGISLEKADELHQVVEGVVNALKEPLLEVPLYVGDLFEGGK